MTSLKPYSAYKESDFGWLGGIPEHWRVQRAKTLLAENSDRAGDNDLELLSLSKTKGILPQRHLTDRLASASDFSQYRRVKPGQLVMNRMQAWNGLFGTSPIEGMISPDYAVFDVNGRSADLRYLLRLVRHPLWIQQFASLSTGVGTGFNRLYSEDLGRVPFLVPPLDEQRAIADFLDGMDARITRFIAARRKMIALLEEKKQAVINQAVTRGLDPDVPMKDSGVDWLGEIPAHWETIRIRSAIVDSVAGVWGDEPTDENEPDHVWCVRVADFDITTLSISDEKKTVRAVPERARAPRLLSDGDILLEKSGGGENQPVGRAVIFDWDEDAVTSNFVTRLRPDRSVVEPHFLLNVLEAMQAARITQLSIKQTTGIQNLDKRHYLSNSVPLPKPGEQQEIVEHIAGETTRIDTLISRHRSEIELMQEYRTRLISDVVTGKLDVRGVELSAVEEVIGEEIEAAMEPEAVEELDEVEA